MTDLERAQVFGAQAWEKAGKGQDLTMEESRVVLRTLGRDMFRAPKGAMRAQSRVLAAA